MDSSTKVPKDVGQCSACWGSFKIQKKDGALHKHGHDGAKDSCSPGSYKVPVDKLNRSRRSNAPSTSSSYRDDGNGAPLKTNKSNRDDGNGAPPTANTDAQNTSPTNNDRPPHSIILDGWALWHVFRKQHVQTALSYWPRFWMKSSASQTATIHGKTFYSSEVTFWQS